MTEFILQFGISEELKGPLIIKNKRPLRLMQFDCECSYIHIKNDHVPLKLHWKMYLNYFYLRRYIIVKKFHFDPHFSSR